MADVFISYAAENRAAAARLAQALEHAGRTVWWDHQLRSGSDFSQAIGRELEAAGAILVLWSREACVSTWVRDEANEGLRRGVLLPVLIEPVQPPLGFRSLHATNLVGWLAGTDDTVLHQLLDDLSALREGGTQRPSAAPAKARATGFRTRRRLWTGVAALVATSSTAGWFAWRHFSAPDTVKPFAEIAMVDCTVVGPGRYEVFARGSVSGSPGMIASAEARPGPHPLTLDCHPWPPESALFPGHCRRYGELANEPAFKGRSLWGTRTTIQADEPPTSLVRHVQTGGLGPSSAVMASRSLECR